MLFKDRQLLWLRPENCIDALMIAKEILIINCRINVKNYIVSLYI